MSKTLISWTDETANPLTGCTECDPACLNCYARVASASPRLQQFEKYHGVVDEKGRWTSQINFAPDVLEKLLHKKKPCKIFMPSMSDMFHPGVKDEWIDQIMATIALTPHITYQCLTKRPERMLDYCETIAMHRRIRTRTSFEPAASKLFFNNENSDFYVKGKYSFVSDDLKQRNWHHKTNLYNVWPLPNLWLGVTAGTQKGADDRIPCLQRLGEMGYITFVSVEPMLEEVNFKKVGYPRQIIIGGESGQNSRPFHLEWAQSLIEQCHSTNTKVFMKQVGSNAFYQGKPFKTKSRAGSDPSEWPDWAQVQEFPNN